MTANSPGPPPFKSLWSFIPGGVFIATDGIDQLPQLSSSPEHGAWVRMGQGEVSITGMKLRFDPNGNFIGTFAARGAAKLDEDANAFNGSATVQLFDISGTPFFSTSVVFRGTRIRV